MLIQYRYSIFLILFGWLLITTIGLGNVYANSPYYTQLNERNGLPSLQVYDIMQDSKGFIWMACEEGLVRYDGTHYKIFRNKNQVYTPGSSLQEDIKGRIWYENFDGRLYYYLNDSLHEFPQKETYNYYPIGLNKHYLLQVQKGRVDVFDIQSLKKIKQLPLTDYIRSENAADGYYIQNKDCLIKIDSALHSKSYCSPLLKDVYKSICYPKGELTIVANNTIIKQKIEQDATLKTFPILLFEKKLTINSILCINDNYWLATTDGAYCLDGSGKQIAHLFPSQNVSEIIIDREGSYWFATTNNGVYIVTDFNSVFIPTKEFSPKLIQSYNEHYYIADAKGQFWKMKSSKDNSYIPLNHSLGNVHYFFIDTIDRSAYYSATGSFRSTLPLFSSTLPMNIALKEACVVDHKYVAIAANGFCGLMKKDISATTIPSTWDSFFTNQPKVETSNIAYLFGENIRGRCIAYNSYSNAIYLSGNKGTYKVTAHYTKEIRCNNASFYAKKLIPIKDKIFALTTMGKLYSIVQDSLFTNLTEQLNIESTHSIKQYGDNLILFTSKGFRRLSSTSLQLNLLETGIMPQDVSDYIIEDNHLVLATESGIIQQPLSFQNNSKKTTSLVINSIEVNNKRIENHPLIPIPASLKNFTIDFSVPEFHTNLKSPVYYRLDEEEWIPIDASNILNLQYLPSGEHQIQFKVNDEIQPHSIHLNVHTLFWKTPWFYLLILILVSLVSFFIYRRRVQIISERIGLLEDKVALERELGRSMVKSIKAQMNPHFFYNALNTIQAYIYTNNKKHAGDYLSKFSKLTRMILEMSEKELITVSEEIHALTLYLELEKMRFDNDLTISLDVADDIDTDFVRIPSMLIQPYVENALKHGLLHKKNGRILSVSFTQVNDMLVVKIEDNGIGREKSQQLNQLKHKGHTSFATEANAKRITILNRLKKKKIVVDIMDKKGTYNEALGTLVTIKIPLSDN